MLLLESELTRASTNLKTIDVRQAKLKELLIRAELEGASEDFQRQLQQYIDRFDRLREKVKEAHETLL